MKKCFNVLVALCLTWTIQSCSSSDSEQEQEQEVLDNCIAEWFSTQSDNILVAGVAYGLDPTDENCKAYREVIEEWINQAEDCSIVSQEEIDQAYIDLEEIDCN